MKRPSWYLRRILEIYWRSKVTGWFASKLVVFHYRPHGNGKRLLHQTMAIRGCEKGKTNTGLHRDYIGNLDEFGEKGIVSMTTQFTAILIAIFLCSF